MYGCMPTAHGIKYRSNSRRLIIILNQRYKLETQIPANVCTAHRFHLLNCNIQECGIVHVVASDASKFSAAR
jgi:hypothetical protein